jgi:hypothetical protein
MNCGTRDLTFIKLESTKERKTGGVRGAKKLFKEARANHLKK